MTDNMVFCLSVDMELSVVSPSNRNRIRPRPDVSRARIEELLIGLEKLGVRATFAICGHLMLDSCDGHPDYPDGSFLVDDPESDMASDSGWYARDMVERIRNEGHEIASHSFSHISFRDPRCTEKVARYEISRSRSIAEDLGIEMGTFIFPRHEEAYHHLLVQNGFTKYVTIQSGGSNRTEIPSLEFGLLRVPRHLYLSRAGFLSMVKASMKTLISERSGFFHVWLHDWNLTNGGSIRSVLRTVKQARMLGYQIVTVSDLKPENFI